MALICDTSGIFALYDADNVDHTATVAVVEAEGDQLLVPVVLLAEIDYLLHSRLGADAARDFLAAVERAEFVLLPFLPVDVVRCGELLTRYRDMEIGLADAAVAATAERLDVARLLCLDERHFRAIRPQNLGHFILLPADREESLAPFSDPAPLADVVKQAGKLSRAGEEGGARAGPC